ncbi:phage antirepressor protein/Antirepressor [Bacillus thuringiensis YBT-1518]|uniref:Phage antirepressor protein/Antirepressor n=2 Tax=Bacillus thuringiensis TaxID=1428 RepID=A0A9W3PE78_BACTU|nr:antA/AntB antirepressor family protein [Bacillus thuringiensis]AHA69930.1 phage antirepressor protein/Antirepressor [Bacillus thuringiensis YBT-1518]
MNQLKMAQMPQLKLFKDGIVRIMETDTGNKVVNARDLYEGLKVKTRFNDWVVRQSGKYGFEEGKDFYSFLGKSTGGRPAQEYILKLNTAKELAMVENNEQGRTVRKYFIDVEEKVIHVKQPKSRKKSVNLIFRQEMDIAKTLASITGVKEGIAYAVALERAEQKTGEDFSSYKRLLPAATYETGLLNPTKIGEQIGKKSRVVNKLLQERGLQEKRDKEWRLTDEGKKYAEEMPYTRNGHSGYQIKWSESVIDVLSAPEVMQ